MDSTTGIVVGAFFGSLFLLTCLISAVKAIRDRKRIKARIAQRQQEKLENGNVNHPAKTGIEENESTSLPNEISHRKIEHFAGNGHLTPGVRMPCSKNKTEDANSSYSSSSGLDNLTIQGVDNLTFERSFVDIPLADETSGESDQESKVSASFKPPYESSPVCYHVVKETKPHTVTKPVSNEYKHKHANKHIVNGNESKHENVIRTVSNESKGKDIKIKHLPPECLAVKKLLRRHSYELAISDVSWLPDNPPSYASCVEITNAYNHGYRQREKKYSLGCENRGFDKDDHKRSLAF